MAPLLAKVVGFGAKEFGDFIAAERAKWRKLITDLKTVSATSLEPLFAGDTPAPTQVYASRALRITAAGPEPASQGQCPVQIELGAGTEPEKYSQPDPICSPTTRGAACHAKIGGWRGPPPK